MFGQPLGGARAAATRLADGGEKPPTPHKKSRGRRRRTPLTPIERGRAYGDSAGRERGTTQGVPAPPRAPHSPLPRGGFRAVGWVGAASIKKPAERTPPPASERALPNRPQCPRGCLPIGRLGGWAEGAINKPAKQTPPLKRPNGHTSSRHPAPARLSSPLQVHLFSRDRDANT